MITPRAIEEKTQKRGTSREGGADRADIFNSLDLGGEPVAGTRAQGPWNMSKGKGKGKTGHPVQSVFGCLASARGAQGSQPLHPIPPSAPTPNNRHRFFWALDTCKHKTMAAPASALRAPAGQYVVSKVDQLVNWARKGSIWPMTFG